ncbi:MAG: selenide, water dikinase SelD [PS1 clade bacterium]
MNLKNKTVRLTEYSHGQGCGCKISPKTLDAILESSIIEVNDPNLLVGKNDRDDAAVYDLGNGEAIISTTDFFMPIVDDPFTFGRIAATNAISDVYAMGGTPMMAISIFGWPIEKLSEEIAREVIDGGRSVCRDAGIVLAGGHSIDSPEPIFGLAVTGRVQISYLKENSKARVGDKIFLTKPIGIGILTTAQKQNKIMDKDRVRAVNTMCQLNSVGPKVARIDGVNAITDVTGFGLAGHLLEVCVGSNVAATVDYDSIPILPNTVKYLNQGCSPGGARRNFESYGSNINKLSPHRRSIVCDPQTSGGLLICISKRAEREFMELMLDSGLSSTPIGEIIERRKNIPTIEIL